MTEHPIMAMDTPPLSIIIVSYNTAEQTRRCLRALQPEAAALGAEVIVVDNGSTDGSAARIRAAFPAVRLLALARNLGFGAANNRGAAVARAPWLWLLNSDTRVHRGAGGALLACAAAHADAGAVGSRLLHSDGRLQPNCWRFPTPWIVLADALGLPRLARRPAHYRLAQYRRPMRVDFATGASLLVRRAAFRQIGGFDEGFFMYAEETDLCYRLRGGGRRVYYTPASVVTHLGGGSAATETARLDQFNRSRDRYFRKHYGAGGLGFYRAGAIVGSALRLGLWGGLSLVRGRRADWQARVVLHCRLLRWHCGLSSR